MFPPSAEGEMPAMFAVNQAYVDADHPLKHLDEVAFIPPLGGG
jgi:molybdopterin converting factor small subunit